MYSILDTKSFMRYGANEASRNHVFYVSRLYTDFFDSVTKFATDMASQPYDDDDDEDDDEHDTKLSSDESEYSGSSLGDDSDTSLLLPSSVESSDNRRDDEDVTSSSLNGKPTISFMPDDPVDDEELFPGAALGIMPCVPEPDYEVTIPTTPSDEDEDSTDTVTDVSSKPNLDDLKKHAEKARLKRIDELIVERTMRVKTHPPRYARLRYWSDGERLLAKSLKDTTAIDLPNLESIKLNSDQSFWIRLFLVAWNEDPSHIASLHPNKLKYHSKGVIEFRDGTIGVRLTADDINKRIKAFPRLQILKAKLRTYYREFTPLDRFGIASDIDGNETVPVSEAKKMFDKFNLKITWIVCQLLIKENETFHFTDIICVTDKTEDIKQTTKRPKESTEDDEEEEEIGERSSRSKSKSTKRKKNSDSLII
ncbi:unnamed protein product [Adineta steineri]|uniref:Uncharacterized protein n=2 Tax=Adineta steineri TaxID=433720 RepID=A0A815M883_9BILA|nr:unnamed protein product [Adineta steineri]CAF3968792.1 unnamed protein product [Adineta steineri]